MLNLILYQPQIPQNTGNIGRLCAYTGTKLHLIRPLGFKIEDKHLRRSGMDYWKELNVEEHEDWDAFLSNENRPRRVWLLTTKSERCLWNVKFQETPAGGGYHVYHYERGSWSETARELVWMIYLNEDFEGGETEFLYQKRRIKPSTGTVVIWPAGFTHTHKGNLVLDGTKYVVTGWYYKQPV